MNTKTISEPLNRTKSRRYIRNMTWIQVLQIIGESHKPLSAREIEKGWYTKYKMRTISAKKEPKSWIGTDGRRKYKKEMSHGDIYRIVKILAGFPSGKAIFLCNLNEIFQPTILNSEDQQYLKNLINGTRKILGVPVFNYVHHDRIETYFQVYPDDKEEIVLTFKKWVYPDKSSQETVMEIKIKMNTEAKQRGPIFILKIPGHLNPSVPLLPKLNEHCNDKDKKGYEFSLYLSEEHTEKGFYRNRTPFIDYKLNERAESRISKLREGMKRTPFRDAETKEVIEDLYHYWPETESDMRRSLEIGTIENDSRNFAFFLTIKGFLLYLLGRQDSRKINKVIESLSQNEYAKNDFSFLWKYHIFDEVYGPQYKINVLRDIAFEMQNQIVSSDRNFLLYWITKRFHYAMIYDKSFPSPAPIHRNSISPFLRDFISSNNKKKNMRERKIIGPGFFDQLAIELEDYDKKMLGLLKGYLERELNITTMLLREQNKQEYPKR